MIKLLLIIMTLISPAQAALNPLLGVAINGGSLGVTYQPVCDSVSGLCLTGLTNTGKLYQHYNIINQADATVSVTSAAGQVTPVPSSTTLQKTYAWAYGTSTPDEVAVFNNLYIQMEGATTATGTVIVHTW